MGIAIDLLDKRRFVTKSQKVWHECVGHCDNARIIDSHLMLNLAQVNSVRLAEIHHILQPGIENNAIQIRMRLDYTAEEVGSI